MLQRISSHENVCKRYRVVLLLCIVSYRIISYRIVSYRIVTYTLVVFISHAMHKARASAWTRTLFAHARRGAPPRRCDKVPRPRGCISSAAIGGQKKGDIGPEDDGWHGWVDAHR